MFLQVVAVPSGAASASSSPELRTPSRWRRTVIFFAVFCLALWIYYDVEPVKEALPQQRQELHCLDSAGSPVDWFLAVKTAYKSSDVLMLYGRPNAQLTEFELETLQDGHAIYRTLNQISESQCRVEFSCWNDQFLKNGMQNSCYWRLAHSKGCLAHCARAGFLFKHTIPCAPTKDPMTPAPKGHVKGFDDYFWSNNVKQRISNNV
ncbi:hypothetical protein L596_006558 [Steinernema carpocapsae]|uniref:Uncharacterized protein n=1 Tax=Steinernema carpocapsae TaxID=34508 RepID=A0A4U8V4Y9_STECR|nr:hypothetical protein L596_006558 [Steinernema carpocapsae]